MADCKISTGKCDNIYPVIKSTLCKGTLKWPQVCTSVCRASQTWNSSRGK